MVGLSTSETPGPRPSIPDRPPTSNSRPTMWPQRACPEDLVRISVGLEDVQDILWDLDQALTAAVAATAANMA
jgi:hypothetical protein